MVNLTFKYLKENWIFSLIGIYVVISCTLYMTDVADIGIPCLIKTLTGYDCPGCGSTRAAMAMVQLDFEEAWNYNKLAFFVVPTGLFFIIRDFVLFIKKEQQSNAELN